MTFIIVLICIALQRFLKLDSMSHQVHWIEPYTRWMYSKTNQIAHGHAMVSLLILIIPLLLGISIIFALIYHLFGSIGYFVGSALLLWYCLDARELKNNPYEGGNVSKLFIHTYRHLFAIVFWFAAFGPVGLTLYVVIDNLRRYLESQPDEKQINLLYFITHVQGLLDWVPLRLLGMTFAFVGHFSNSFKLVVDQLFSGIKHNQQQIVDWGLAAQLGDEINAEASLADTFTLIDRALIVWLMALALFNIIYLLG